MGRPPLRPEQRRSESVRVAVTPGERKCLEAEARRRGMTISQVLMLPWRKGGPNGGTA